MSDDGTFCPYKKSTKREVSYSWISRTEITTEHCQSLRADTHADNKIMQHLLEKNGFTRCGIIHVADGSPRFAYQKLAPTQPLG